MAMRKTHNEDCLRLLGNTYDDVHAFLDQMAAVFPPPVFFDYHRSFLHNHYGARLVREMWGLEAFRAAQIHLMRDIEWYITNKPFRTVKLESIIKVYDEAMMKYYTNPDDNIEHMTPRYFAGEMKRKNMGFVGAADDITPIESIKNRLY